MASNNPPTSGSFVPISNVWDVSQIAAINVNSPEFKELLVRLYQNINNIAINLNLKDTGYYFLHEFVCGQLYFPNPSLNSSAQLKPVSRSVYRFVVNFGALPNNTTKSVAHGLSVTSSWTWTRIYGAATDTTGIHGIPLPYASPTLANNIELEVDATNVTIITGANRSNFNVSYVVLEYLKT